MSGLPFTIEIHELHVCRFYLRDPSGRKCDSCEPPSVHSTQFQQQNSQINTTLSGSLSRRKHLYRLRYCGTTNAYLESTRSVPRKMHNSNRVMFHVHPCSPGYLKSGPGLCGRQCLPSAPRNPKQRVAPGVDGRRRLRRSPRCVRCPAESLG